MRLVRRVNPAADEAEPSLIAVDPHPARQHPAPWGAHVGGLRGGKAQPPFERGGQAARQVQGVIAAVVGIAGRVHRAETGVAVLGGAPEVGVGAGGRAPSLPEDQQGVPVGGGFREPVAGGRRDPDIGHRDRSVDKIGMVERGRMGGVGDQPQTRQQIRRDEAPCLRAVGCLEGVKLAVVGAYGDDPQAVGGRPRVAVPVLLERGRRAAVPVVLVVDRGRSHRDGGGPEDVPEFPVVRVVGGVSSDVADHHVAIGVRGDREVLLGDGGRIEVHQRTGLQGLDVPAGRRRVLEHLPRVPERRAHGAVLVHLEFSQMAEPERIIGNRLEGSLVDEVLVDRPVRLDGRLGKGIGGLADDVDRRLHGRDQLVRAARDEGVARQVRVTGIVRTGLEVGSCIARGPRIGFGVVVTGRRRGAPVRCAARDAGRIAGVLGHVAADRGIHLGARLRDDFAAGHDAVARNASAVGRVGVVRPPVIGHPVEGVPEIGGHGRAEADDEDLVARVVQRLGPGDDRPAVSVPVGIAFRTVAVAGKRVRAVGDQDHELRAAFLGVVRGLVGVQVELRLVQGRGDGRSPPDRFALHGRVDRAVVRVDPLDQGVAASGVAPPCIVGLAVVEPHVPEPDAQAGFVRAVDRVVVVVVEDVGDGTLGDRDAAAVLRAASGGARNVAGSRGAGDVAGGCGARHQARPASAAVGAGAEPVRAVAPCFASAAVPGVRHAAVPGGVIGGAAQRAGAEPVGATAARSPAVCRVRLARGVGGVIGFRTLGSRAEPVGAVGAGAVDRIRCAALGMRIIGGRGLRGSAEPVAASGSGALGGVGIARSGGAIDQVVPGRVPLHASGEVDQKQRIRCSRGRKERLLSFDHSRFGSGRRHQTAENPRCHDA